MILDIYKDSLEYPLKEKLTLLKIGIMAFLSFLIIPSLLIYGYNYRVIKVAIFGMINGDDELPKFNDFKTMVVDGLKYLLVNLIYLLIPLGFGYILWILLKFLNSTTINVSVVLITLVLSLIFYLISLMAVPNMAANNDSFKAAFSIRDLIHIIKSIGILNYLGFFIGVFLIVFSFSVVITIILLIVFAALGIGVIIISPSNIPLFEGFMNVIINSIFLFLIVPYLGIFQNRAIGLIYNTREQ